MKIAAESASTRFAFSFDRARGIAMRLDHLGLIAVTGADAATFLQNQLTNDVQGLSSDQARLAGVCSTKGRLLADFVCWRDDDVFYLECSRELLPATLKHLSRFVLRAKAKLEDATAASEIFGLAGERAESFLKDRFAAMPVGDWGISHASAGSLVRLPDSMGLPRWQWIAPAPSADSSLVVDLEQHPSSVWRWLEVRAGVPHITIATQDRFVPQMINFEAIGGVSFKKGCYPGQEVVARSQYLGKLKRRTTVAHSSFEPTETCPLGSLAGCDLVAIAEGTAGKPLGTVVNAERSPLGGIDLLVELPIAAGAHDGSELAAAAPGGEVIPVAIVGLPYTLPDQDVFVRPKL